jgi:hypothetical protein|tara:strand:+ start:61 stop:531 length:471 start_codon:yes stop_codon:yes gene_type:complete
MTKPKKTFVLLLLFFFFSSCGYTPIFSKKEINFSLENVKFSGDKHIEKKINNILYSYKNKPDKKEKISLVIASSKSTSIASKNTKGEALTNRINVDVNAKIFFAENNFIEKNYSKTSIYTVVDRKSEQKLTENKLIENLSNEIAQQIIFEISKNIK